MRDETTSYYLFDGHGDVRVLNNDEGRITDKYRYNAYGELVERSGETENHYLYTGEYYDGTSNLYYLRARYMNPSTGTFISMDTYEGSIYDPDTLHKYLYANGNPVKYSDPTGNFSAVTMAAGMAINDCITTAYNVHLMGILSGLSNMAVNSILGKQGVGLVSDFFEGYQSGVWTAGILYLTAAISVKAFAAVAFGMAAADTIMCFVLLVASVNEKNTKGILVYGTLMILSIVDLYQVHNLYGTITVTGDKGENTVVVECNDDAVVPTVTATFEHNGQSYHDVNPTARKEIDKNSDIIPGPKGQKGISGVNNTMEKAHAEIGAMNQSRLDGNTGGDAVLIVTGQPVCSYCRSDVKKMSLVLDLKNLTVYEKATGKIYTFNRDTGDFYNVKDGGKRWE